MGRLYIYLHNLFFFLVNRFAGKYTIVPWILRGYFESIKIYQKKTYCPTPIKTSVVPFSRKPRAIFLGGEGIIETTTPGKSTAGTSFQKKASLKCPEYPDALKLAANIAPENKPKPKPKRKHIRKQPPSWNFEASNKIQVLHVDGNQKSGETNHLLDVFP